MSKQTTPINPGLTGVSYEPVRRLSLWRVLLALLVLAGIAAGVKYGLPLYKSLQVNVAQKPWFGAYADVTATPTYAFEELGATSTKNVILSFIVSSPKDACTPTWGGAYTLDDANSALDLDRRIARLRQQHGHIAVSFGGLKNTELAVSCTDPDQLAQAYAQVINRYNLDTIDLDLEGTGLTDAKAGDRRAQALAKLQSSMRAKGKNLAIWVTLPVSTSGLSQDGTNAIAQLLAKKVDLAGVNVMTMDYGDSLAKNQSMASAAHDALNETHRQLGILYTQAGIHLNSGTIWTKIGATPMIGQNDITNEVFSVDDAKTLNQFARSVGLGRMSMWSVNRDIPCGDNYVNTQIVSDSCSGVTSAKLDFSQALSNGFTGDISAAASKVTTSDKTNPDQIGASVQTTDDPKTSPYQIWQPTGAYLEGTKVVWHHNVYEAKWWTQGDLPDNPVLQSYQTPWKLIGPVLPGETPIPQPTLPAGTYPDWTGTDAYQEGQRVLFNGIPYQAKWWNQAQSPAAASTNADSSPWVPLTMDEIRQVLDQAKN